MLDLDLDLIRLNENLKAVRNILAAEPTDRAEFNSIKAVLEANLKELGRCARSGNCLESTDPCSFLESYSKHCFYYAVVLDKLGEWETVEEFAYTAAFIYPRYDEEYYDACQSIWQRAMVKRGFAPTLTIKEFFKEKHPELNNCAERLAYFLKYLP